MQGEPMLLLPRMSSIYYGGKFYDYPLRPGNALRNMGVCRAASRMLSYAKARVFRKRNPKNYEEWVTNQFGAKLFEMFFRSYTEKVWGMPCSEIGAEWAAQRIKGLSLGAAVRNALIGSRQGKNTLSTLIDEFRYPKLGPGQLWENAAKLLTGRGWKIRLNTPVIGAECQHNRVASVNLQLKNGETK